MILNKDEQELFEQSLKDLKITEHNHDFDEKTMYIRVDKNFNKFHYSSKKNKHKKISILEKYKRKRFEHYIYVL